MKNLTRDLVLVGMIIAFLVPAVTAAEPYITVMTDGAVDFKGLHIATVEILDPLDTEATLVTLEGDGLTLIPRPEFGEITRAFDPASGTYQGANVTLEGHKTIDGNTLPSEYGIYTERTIPEFTIDVPDRYGNVLMVKLPKSFSGAINFTELFRAAEEQGYLFTEDTILYSNSTGISAYGGLSICNYDLDDLGFTLERNEVNLSGFSPDYAMVQSMMESWPYVRPEAGEYLIAAVEYDSASETMRVLAILPTLILDGDTPISWNGDDPYYKDWSADATLSFGEEVNQTAYIMLRSDTAYDLTTIVNTEELADQPIPTSVTDLVPLIWTATDETGPISCILAPGGTPIGTDMGSGLIIAEGYGISGYADAPDVEISADALATLDPGSYTLYALGIDGEEIIAFDYQEIEIWAAPLV